ncbi:MAG: hypothetical protein ACOX0E_03670 [Syntrophomonadaceae bacterium]|jgi:16S rRNA C1402 N4-methylase RsmH
MVILLKIFAFAMWMTIMIFLLVANKNKARANFRAVRLYLNDHQDVEMAIKKALSRLGREDRLVIEDFSGQDRKKDMIIENVLKKNHSIVYFNPGKKCS